MIRMGAWWRDGREANGMARYTRKAEDGAGYVAAADSVTACAEGWRGPAVDRLAVLEELCERLEKRVREIPQEQAALRAQGWEKTVRFRELTGEKMMAMVWLEMAGEK